MKYTHLFFDLDGTLTDPFEGITKSVQIALSRFGIEVKDRNDLKCFIGPPLTDGFMNYYGLSESDAIKAVEYYREYFSVTGLFENSVYEGIPETLEKLKGNGYTLVIATSKPAVFSRRIADKFDLSKYFVFLSGSELNGERVRKGDVISYAIENLGIADRSKILMIGDRKHDILGAKECNVDSCGVLWGYGDRAELTSAGADYIVENLEELQKILL